MREGDRIRCGPLPYAWPGASSPLLAAFDLLRLAKGVDDGDHQTSYAVLRRPVRGDAQRVEAPSSMSLSLRPTWDCVVALLSSPLSASLDALSSSSSSLFSRLSSSSGLGICSIFLRLLRLPWDGNGPRGRTRRPAGVVDLLFHDDTTPRSRYIESGVAFFAESE